MVLNFGNFEVLKKHKFCLKKVSYYLSGHGIVVTQLCSVHTHCEAMVQLACTIIGLICLETYLNGCAAVLLGPRLLIQGLYLGYELQNWLRI